MKKSVGLPGTDAVDLPDEGPKLSFFQRGEPANASAQSQSEDHATRALAMESGQHINTPLMKVVVTSGTTRAKQHAQEAVQEEQQKVGVELNPWGEESPPPVSIERWPKGQMIAPFPDANDPYRGIAATPGLHRPRLQHIDRRPPVPVAVPPTPKHHFAKPDRHEWLATAPRMLKKNVGSSISKSGSKSKKRRNFHNIGINFGKGARLSTARNEDTEKAQLTAASTEDLYTKLFRSSRTRFNERAVLPPHVKHAGNNNKTEGIIYSSRQHVDM